MCVSGKQDQDVRKVTFAKEALTRDDYFKKSCELCRDVIAAVGWEEQLSAEEVRFSWMRFL